METPTELIDRFRLAAEELEARYVDELLDDEDTDGELRAWIDGNDSPLDWAYSDHVTADEWFFISTLYGEMNLDGQRTHIPQVLPDAIRRGSRPGHEELCSRHARVPGTQISMDVGTAEQDGCDPSGP